MSRVWFLVLAASCANGTTGGTDVPADTDTTDTDADPPVPTTGTSDDRIDGIVALDGDVGAGKTFYEMNCPLCHLLDGTGNSGEFSGADLTQSTLDEAGIVAKLVRGVPDTRMASYATYQNQQIADAAAYVLDAFVP